MADVRRQNMLLDNNSLGVLSCPKPYTVGFRFRVLRRILRRLPGDVRVQTTLAKNSERCTKKMQYQGPKVEFRVSLGRVIVQRLVYSVRWQ